MIRAKSADEWGGLIQLPTNIYYIQSSHSFVSTKVSQKTRPIMIRDHIFIFCFAHCPISYLFLLSNLALVFLLLHDDISTKFTPFSIII